MPKFRILGQFDIDGIVQRVPPDYRGVVRTVARADAEYTVILFAHDRKDVVTSRSVRRALEKVGAGRPVLAVGANFTAEATALLNELGIPIARLGEFYWTDASFESVRSAT